MTLEHTAALLILFLVQPDSSIQNCRRTCSNERFQWYELLHSSAFCLFPLLFRIRLNRTFSHPFHYIFFSAPFTSWSVFLPFPFSSSPLLLPVVFILLLPRFYTSIFLWIFYHLLFRHALCSMELEAASGYDIENVWSFTSTHVKLLFELVLRHRNFLTRTRSTRMSKIRSATEMQRVGRRQSWRGRWCSREIRRPIPVGRAALLSITRSQLHLASPLVIPQDGALLERGSVIIGLNQLITFLYQAWCAIWKTYRHLVRLCLADKKSGSGNYILTSTTLHRCCLLPLVK